MVCLATVCVMTCIVLFFPLHRLWYGRWVISCQMVVHHWEKERRPFLLVLNSWRDQFRIWACPSNRGTVSNCTTRVNLPIKPKCSLLEPWNTYTRESLKKERKRERVVLYNPTSLHNTCTMHSSLSNCPTEDTLADDPDGLRVELMRHQRRALAWMQWRETQTPSAGILGKRPNFIT